MRVPAQNAPFRRVRFSLPAQTWSRLTEKRTLGGGLTEKRSLGGSSHTECVFPSRRSHRMRLFVECAFPYLRKRGAVSRKSAFCSGDLTEKRILGGRPHGEAHSGWAASLKSAFWKVGVTGKRILRFSDRANCAFPSHCRPRGMRCNHPPGCGALSKVAQLGKCVRATARQAAGRFAPGSANLVWSLTSRKVAVWVRSLGAQSGRAVWMRSLGRWSYGKAHPRSGRDTISSPMAIPVRVYEGHQEV